MGYLKDIRRILKVIKAGQSGYGVVMKFIDNIKRKIELVVVIVVIWAVVMLGLAIYIAVKVS